MAVETVDGQQWSIGDTDVDFSIQSCSKPLVYCLALEELGAEYVGIYIRLLNFCRFIDLLDVNLQEQDSMILN